MKKYALVIPIYRSYIDEVEKFNLNNNVHKLGKYHICLALPKTLNLSWHLEHDCLTIVRFDDVFFQGYQGYSRLLMSEQFYRTFAEYEKILICQLDAYIFEDRMEYFCALPYDYIGAPAFLHFFEDGSCEVRPGNGGFSLRDVHNTLQLLKHHVQERDMWKDTEDAFFSFCAMKYPHEFRMPSAAVAASFAFDRFVSVMFDWNRRQVPFGIHAWSTYAPEFVCRFLTERQKRSLNHVLKGCTSEEILSPFHAFLSRSSTVLLYGAGDWGRVIGRALQILQVNIGCFVVSDGHVKPGEEIFGIPVRYLSEIMPLDAGTGVILSMSQRYLTVEERDDLHQTIVKKGVEEILDVDNRLFNFIAEIVLREKGRRFL